MHDEAISVMSINIPIEVKFEKIHPDAKLPTRATDGRGYYDVYTVEDVMLSPEQVSMVHTGLKLQPCPGWIIDVRPRSGLAKKGITVSNSPGVVDSDYGGELLVELIWHVPEHAYGDDYIHHNLQLSADSIYIINKGDRIAQLNVLPSFNIKWIDRKVEGTAGFGSTGK